MVLLNFSGCQPRRYSSPIVTFCVHMIWPPCWNFETQILQPMHSRMSSSGLRRSSWEGTGSAIDGRAAPMMSSTPARSSATMSSGLVSRPLPTTGMPDPENGLALLDEGRHPAGFAEAGCAGIFTPFGIVADLQRHRVDHAFTRNSSSIPYAVFVGLDALRTVQGVHFESRRDGAPVPRARASTPAAVR